MEFIAETFREAIVTIASDLVGAPSIKYNSGHPDYGQSPTDGFDCSGFVRYVLQEAGLSIPDYIGMDGLRRPIRHANEFWDHYGIGVHDEYAQPGDLLFFSREGTFPTHVGIVAAAGAFIHAPGIAESRVERSIIEFEEIASNGMKRQIYKRNPIGFKSPVVPIASPTYRYHQRPLAYEPTTHRQRV